MTDDYNAILMQYPATISKEQLYKICRISKRTASFLLESGAIPCRSSGKKTRKYTIATADVVAFLRKRDTEPGYYTALLKRSRFAKENGCAYPDVPEKMLLYSTEKLTDYPDLLSIEEVSDAVGVSRSTITRWCRYKYFKHFTIRGRCLIPKAALLEYLAGQQNQE